MAARRPFRRRHPQNGAHSIALIFLPISFYVVQKLIPGLLAGGSPILQQLHCVLAGLKKFTIEHAKRTYELTFTGTAELLQLL